MTTTLVLISITLNSGVTFNTPIPIGTVQIDLDPALPLEFSSSDPSTAFKFITTGLTGSHTFTVNFDPLEIDGLTIGTVGIVTISFIDYKVYFTDTMNLDYNGTTVSGTGTFII